MIVELASRCGRACIDHLVADRLILGPIRHQAPPHRPRLDGAGALSAAIAKLH